MLEFKNLDALKEYQKTVPSFKPGEMVTLTDDNIIVMYDNNGEWHPLKANQTGDGITMTLYDFNKQIMVQMPPLSAEVIDAAAEEINHTFQTGEYFMLLCNDIAYYTIFKADAYGELYQLGNAVIECLKSVGEPVSIEKNDYDVFEIWVKVEDEAYCMYLFPYDEGVVKFRR